MNHFAHIILGLNFENNKSLFNFSFIDNFLLSIRWYQEEILNDLIVICCFVINVFVFNRLSTTRKEHTVRGVILQIYIRKELEVSSGHLFAVSSPLTQSPSIPLRDPFQCVDSSPF